MSELKQLKEMALQENRVKHPNLPDEARYVRHYSDRTANELTRAIIDYLRLSGHQAERIAVTGRYIDNTKVFTDVTGFRRKIGSGKWINSSMQKGSSDISATIYGRSVKIEIKVGRDRQSPHQKTYQEQIERAGGLYWLVRTFDEFVNFYNSITELIKIISLKIYFIFSDR